MYYQAVVKYTTIDELLHEISEETMAEEVGKPCDAARERLKAEKVRVADRDEYERELSRFMSAYSQAARVRKYADQPLGWTEHILEEAYGDPCLPLELATSGEAGGLVSIFNTLHEFVKKEMTDHLRKLALDSFRPEERERLMGEYISSKYGDHLPRRYQGQRAVILAINSFNEVMIHHATVIEPALRAEAERA